MKPTSAWSRPVSARASASMPTPTRAFPATVTQVRYAPETKDGVVTYTTVLRVDNGDLALRPGMTATAEIVVREVKDALLVPNAALRFVPPAAPRRGNEGGILGKLMMRFPSRQASMRSAPPSGRERRVWVLDGDTPRAVNVTIGDTDEKFTAVTGGDLAAGMKVAVDYRPAAR